MTAPGQEPDEIMTGTPGGVDDPEEAAQEQQEKQERQDREPDLGAVGDNHMPGDLRRAEQEAGEEARRSG